MDEQDFKRMVGRHGAAPERWPEAHRPAALRLLARSATARRAWATEQALDTVLDQFVAGQAGGLAGDLAGDLAGARGDDAATDRVLAATLARIDAGPLPGTMPGAALASRARQRPAGGTVWPVAGLCSVAFMAGLALGVLRIDTTGTVGTDAQPALVFPPLPVTAILGDA